MLSRPVLCFGSETPLPERIPLRAGPLHLTFEQGDLRTICLGECEILRRVYVAVRDRNWGTVPPVFSNLVVQAGDDSFLITYSVSHRQSEIDFAWQGTIRGDADGTITFSMAGLARTTFLKNRIGFCVLFPAGCAGEHAVSEHVDGRQEDALFSMDICADQPVPCFDNMRALSYSTKEGAQVEVRFAGDAFEMEDQRLWTDASYKVFCTLLNRPYPVEIQAGTRVSQSVTIAVRSAPSGREPDVPSPKSVFQPEALRLLFPTRAVWKPLPLIGLGLALRHPDEGLADGAGPLSESSVSRLAGLHLHHLRVDLRLSDPVYADRLRRAMRAADFLGVVLELALFITAEDAETELKTLRQQLDGLKPRVGSWLVYPAEEIYAGGSPTGQVLHAARGWLRSYDPALPFAAGTNTDFIFLKRSPPPIALMDQVCIALNPQVHAFDNQSLVETLEAQPMVVASAHRLAQGLPVVVSPVTLKPRFNPYATAPAVPPPPGTLPPEVDARQGSLFGAGWTLGSLRAMLAGSVASVTYYETTGWRGVMAEENGPSLPLAWFSLSSAVYPLFHILADVGEFAGGQGAAMTSSDALKFSALALRKGRNTRILLANHTPEEQHVNLQGLAGDFASGFLDETNGEEAMLQPEIFRARPREMMCAVEGQLELRLRPFGCACLDQQ